MASTYTTRIGLEKQADGENANTWGLRLNTNVIDLVDEATAGYEAIDISGGATTLTDTMGLPTKLVTWVYDLLVHYLLTLLLQFLLKKRFTL